jgi:hypothetical protein
MVNDLPSDEVLKRYQSDLLRDNGGSRVERRPSVFLGLVGGLVKGGGQGSGSDRGSGSERGSVRGSDRFYSNRGVGKRGQGKKGREESGSLKSGGGSEVDGGKLGEISKLLSGSMKHILGLEKKADGLTQSQITGKINLMLSQNEVKKDIFEDGEFTKKAKQSIFEKSAQGKRGSMVSRKSKIGMDSLRGEFGLVQLGP